MVNKYWRIIFLMLLLLALAYDAKAEPNFEFSNDFFAPNGKDRFLTNRFGWDFKIDEKSTLGMHQDMYTPDNLRVAVPDETDGLYDGYTYLSYKAYRDVSALERRKYILNIGLLGDASKAKRAQKFIHNDLDKGTDPQGWDSQNASEVALDFIYGHSSMTELSSYLGNTLAIQEYGVRLGNVKSLVYLDQEISKKFFCRYTAFAGLRGEMKAFDTHIQGRMFHSNKHTREMIPFVAIARVGVGVDVGEYNIGLAYYLQTRSFEDQEGRHLYGSLTVRKSF